MRYGLNVSSRKMSSPTPNYFSENPYIPGYDESWILEYLGDGKMKLSQSYSAWFGFPDCEIRELRYVPSVGGYAEVEHTKSGVPFKHLKLIDHIDGRILVNSRLYAFIVDNETWKHPLLKPLYCSRFHNRRAMKVADGMVYCDRCNHFLTPEEINKL